MGGGFLLQAFSADKRSAGPEVGKMKRLLLIPATLVTALLAVAFVSPATASSAVRAVVPQLHIVGFPSISALAGGQQASTTADSSRSSATSGQDTTSSGPASQSAGSALDAILLQAPPPGVGYSIVTPSTENCGRFGGGYHGGKHLMVCPNRPFPPPPNH
jgi:opacity protein-like surface antigen